MNLFSVPELEPHLRLTERFWASLYAALSGARNEERVDFLSRNHAKLKPSKYIEDSQMIGRERDLMNLYIGQYDLAFSKVGVQDLQLQTIHLDHLKALVGKASSLRRHPEVEKKLQVAREAAENGVEWEGMDQPTRLAVTLLAGAITAWDKHVSEMEKKAS